MITHLKSTHPKHSLHEASIKIYKCPGCGREEATDSNRYLNFGPSSWCPDCSLKGKVHRMKEHSRIESQKVDEIKNRINVPSEKDKPYEPDQMDVLWEEGRVPKHVKTTICSEGDGGRLKIQVYGRFSKESWKENVVQLTFPDGEKAYFRLADIGEALKPMISEVL